MEKSPNEPSAGENFFARKEVRYMIESITVSADRGCDRERTGRIDIAREAIKQWFGEDATVDQSAEAEQELMNLGKSVMALGLRYIQYENGA